MDAQPVEAHIERRELELSENSQGLADDICLLKYSVSF